MDWIPPDVCPKCDGNVDIVHIPTGVWKCDNCNKERMEYIKKMNPGKFQTK